MSKYKLFCVQDVIKYLSRFQREILSESINNDIFLIITKKYLNNDKIAQSGLLIVIDDKGNQYSSRVKKAIPELMQYVSGEVACLPGRQAESIKASQVSLCYGKTFEKRIKGILKLQHGAYSCNTDLQIGDKWYNKAI